MSDEQKRPLYIPYAGPSLLETPLLNKGSRRSVIEDLMHEREPLYRQEADIVYVTDSRSPQAAAREIAGEIREKWQS